MKDKNKKRRETLNKLQDLNSDIRAKEKERKNCIAFNKKNHIPELEFDIKKLTEELIELELEFKRESRNP